MSRRIGWRVAVVAALALCQWVSARADVYVVRDPSGAIVLTNVPAGSADSTSARVLAEGEAPSDMDVTAAGLAPAAIMPSFSPRPDDGRYDDLIREVADEYGVEFALVKAVVRVESAFDPFAISRKGAQGLMQLMPQTARLHGVNESFRPRDNVEGGVRHLRGLLDRYGGNLPLALAAYNAGSGRVESSGGVPDITETRDYVLKVLRYRKLYLEQEGGGVLQARR